MSGWTLPEAFWPFMLASLLIELTPGPNMAWLAILTVTQGRLRGLQAMAGVALGLAVLGAAGAFGVTEIISNSRPVYEALRWAGIAFLIYLAWEGWRGDGDADEDGKGDHRAFLRGFLSNMLNPKAAIFYVAVLPAFVSPGQPAGAQTAALTAGYVLVATLVHMAIVLMAARLQPYLVTGDRATRVRRTLSLALLATALWFGWTTAR